MKGIMNGMVMQRNADDISEIKIFLCNLTDSKGYSLPAFGPVKLTKLIF